MYITNPTKEDLDNWYKCNYTLGYYLEVNKDFLAIYKDRYNYYFVKTKDLQQVLNTLPLLYKVAKYF
jgi:hypothetical protein